MRGELFYMPTYKDSGSSVMKWQANPSGASGKNGDGEVWKHRSGRNG